MDFNHLVSRRVVFAAGFLLVAVFAAAQGQSEAPAITFPIPELGNCGSKDECKLFCDDAANHKTCRAFAVSRGLVREGPAVVNEGKRGPNECENEEACRAYCDEAGHREECIAFAEENGYFTRKEAERSRKYVEETAQLRRGPGGCASEEECRAYCDNSAYAEECLRFAKNIKLIDDEEFEKERKMLEAVHEEGGPGGCASDEECRVYCEDPAHIEKCVDFAVAHGFMDEREAEFIKKHGRQGVRPQDIDGPGGCKGKEACRAYCDEESHFEECISFAEQNGFMTTRDAQRARAVSGKTGPGGCRGRSCEAYCQSLDHHEECFEFAVREGLIKPEEADRGRKFLKAAKDGGPGGCVGDGCRVYCSQPDHQGECFEFARKNGLVSEEDEKRFERTRGLKLKVAEVGGPGGCRDEGACAEYCHDPAQMEECLAFAVAHGGFDRKEAEKFLKYSSAMGPHPGGDVPGEFGGGFGPPRDGQFEMRMRRFDDLQQFEMKFRADPSKFGRDNFAGPGGCASPEECFEYCKTHPEECGGRGFGPEGGRPGFIGGGGGSIGGPGGCSSPEECMQYCLKHPEECKRQTGESFEHRAPESFNTQPMPQYPPNAPVPPYPPEFQRPEGSPENFQYRPPEGTQSLEEYTRYPNRGYKPPEGGYISPLNTFPEGAYQPPPEGYVKPPSDFYQPPLDGGVYQQPPPPQTQDARQSVFASVLAPIIMLFGLIQ